MLEVVNGKMVLTTRRWMMDDSGCGRWEDVLGEEEIDDVTVGRWEDGLSGEEMDNGGGGGSFR